VLGIAVGGLVSLAVARFVEPLLFQQSATDPAVFLVVGALLLAVAIVACAVPAAKAMHADPNTVLRAD
jgi:putative ABC transport system permease protein